MTDLMTERRCMMCNVLIVVSEKEAARGKGKYCSRLCANRGAGTFGADKIRQTKIAKRSGNEHSYPKLLGRHEHRVVAEGILGRPLGSSEIVHHKDENKLNNDPTNLEVLESQAAHARLHFTKHECCTVAGCGRKHKSNGYCAMHESRRRRYGDINFTKYIRRNSHASQG